MTGATLRGADPVEAELLAAGRARAVTDDYGQVRGAVRSHR